jgi:hypothetical protein
MKVAIYSRGLDIEQGNPLQQLVQLLVQHKIDLPFKRFQKKVFINCQYTKCIHPSTKCTNLCMKKKHNTLKLWILPCVMGSNHINLPPINE